MSKLTETFTNIFKIQELRERLLFTTLLLIIVRIGAHITVPGVDAVLLLQAAYKLRIINVGKNKFEKGLMQLPLMLNNC